MGFRAALWALDAAVNPITKYKARRRQKEEERRRLAQEKAEKEERERRERAARIKDLQEKVEAAKQFVSRHFDAVAVDGKIQEADFKEALQPFIKEILQIYVDVEHMSSCVYHFFDTSDDEEEEDERPENPKDADNEKAGSDEKGQEGAEGEGDGGASADDFFQDEELQLQIKPLIKEKLLDEGVTRLLACDKSMHLLYNFLASAEAGGITWPQLEALVDEVCKITPDGCFVDSEDVVWDMSFPFANAGKDGKLTLSELQYFTSALLQVLSTAVSVASEFAVGVAESPALRKFQPLRKLLDPFKGLRADFEQLIDAELEEDEKDRYPIMDIIHWLEVAMHLQEILGTPKDSSWGTTLISAFEWFQGGISVEAFVKQLTPKITDFVNKWASPELVRTALNKLKEWTPLEDADIFDETVMLKPWFADVVTQFREKVVEFIPEFCRLLFRVMDIDNDGKVSQREISVVRELLHSVVTMSICDGLKMASISGITPSEATRQELQNLCPEAFAGNHTNQLSACKDLNNRAVKTLALSCFDMVDRDADGVLTVDEGAAFVGKVLVAGLRAVQCALEASVGALSILANNWFSYSWSDSNVTEVTSWWGVFNAML